MKAKLAVLALVGTMLLFAGKVAASEVRISAAASLSEAVKELVADYRRRHPGIELRPNFASSGALARQIAAGAPVDIYISANPQWMDHLRKQGLIAAGSERILAFNSLVFVGPPQTIASTLEALPKLRRIAIGSPRAVPAGRYAEQALNALGLYRPLLAAGKLVTAKDVRQALLYAERGEVDGAFVYRTDALLAKKAGILFEVPQALYPRVTYPAALTPRGAEIPAVQAFFAYLQGTQAGRILTKHGFVPPDR